MKIGMRPSSKELRALKAGDHVRIHLAHPASTKNIAPEDVVIENVVDHWQFDMHGKKSLPLIQWTSKSGSTSSCNASFVIDILSIAPYRPMKALTNIYCQPIHQATAPVFSKGNCVAESPVALASRIVSFLGHLDIPFGFSEYRLTEAWAKAGHPGLRGTYHLYSGQISAKHMRWRPSEPFSGVDDRLYDYAEFWWIHRPTFQNWLMKALPHVVRPRKEFIRECVNLAKLAAEEYLRDLKDENEERYRFGT